MNAIIGIIVAGITAVFLTIPVWNSRVFHSVNVSDVIEQGKDGLSSIVDNINRANYGGVRDTARSLVQRFRNDSTTFFMADVHDWDKALLLVKEAKDEPATNFLLGRIRPEDADSFKTVEAGSEMTMPLRMRIINALNSMVIDPAFYTANSRTLAVDRDRACKGRLQQLVAEGIIRGDNQLTTDLSPATIRKLRSFHVEVISRLLYPQFLRKERNRNTDWASEFIAQTALYYYAESYRIERRTEDAIKAFDSLLIMYPRAVQAEKIFLEIGQILSDEGRSKMLPGGDAVDGAEKLDRAIRYLERVERNREVAKEFPKYKSVELQPGQYTNLDEAAKAKKKVKQKTEMYTQQQAKADVGGGKKQGEGGNTLEDAVRLIGECYIWLGKTDSARMQLRLLPDYFPESDNLDDAQKLVADSYVKDGDRIIAADSSGAEARLRADKAYENAVKQFQKFINVYPQSDLISQVYISLGDTYTKMRKPAEAGRAFAAALDLAKETEDKANIQLQIGNYYLERRQFSQAVKAYEVILSSFSGVEKAAASAQYLMGVCFESQGDTAGAVKAYETVVSYYKQSEHFPACAVRVGQWNFKNGNYKEAQRYFKDGYSYGKDGPLAAQCLYEWGMVWVKMAEEAKDKESQDQNYAEAIKQLNKVVDLFRDVVGQEDWVDKASFQLAQCYMKSNREDAARKATKTIKNRALVVSAIKIIGIDIDDPTKEVEYWDRLYQDATEDEERAAILYDKASVVFDKINDPEGALALYRKILELSKNPNRLISANIGIGRVYVAQKKYPEAAAQFDTLLQNPRLSTEIRQQLQVQLFDAYFNGKQYDKALEGFNSFAALYPEHDLTPYAIYRSGMVLAQQGKNKEALEKMRIVVDKWAKSEYYDKAVLGVGEQMIALGQVAEGVAYLEKFLASGPLDAFDAAPNIYLRVGETYKNQLKDAKKAIANFQTVVEKYPDSYLFSYAAHLLGTALKEEGREKEAMAAFEKVKKENGAIYRAAQAEIGKILAKTDPEAAVRNFEKIVQVSETPEDSAVAMIGIGDVYVVVKKWAEAALTFGKVYESYRGNDTNLVAGAIAKWVDALMNDKQYDAAIKAAQIMQEKYPDNQYTVNAVYFEGSAWFAKKNYTNARKKFLEIIQGNKSAQMTEIAYFQKGDCFYFSEKFADAVKEYDAYVKQYPEGKYRASALYMQGNAYWNLQDFAKAKDMFQAVVSKYPDFPDICNAKNFLAFSLNKIDKWKEASKLYTEVLNSASCAGSPKEFARKQKEAIGTQH